MRDQTKHEPPAGHPTEEEPAYVPHAHRVNRSEASKAFRRGQALLIAGHDCGETIDLLEGQTPVSKRTHTWPAVIEQLDSTIDVDEILYAVFGDDQACTRCDGVQ